MNYLSTKKQIPNELQILWGDAIKSMISIKNSLNKVGIRGNQLQQQNKQAILCSMIILNDDNKTIQNRKILNQIIPQKNISCKDNYIQTCIDIKSEFNKENIKILCLEKR